MWILARRWKRHSDFKDSKWIIEIGDYNEENSLIKPNNSNVIWKNSII